jgi:hypothetical protein
MIVKPNDFQWFAAMRMHWSTAPELTSAIEREGDQTVSAWAPWSWIH